MCRPRHLWQSGFTGHSKRWWTIFAHGEHGFMREVFGRQSPHFRCQGCLFGPTLSCKEFLYPAHQNNLVSPFFEVLLIDAYSIDPPDRVHHALAPIWLTLIIELCLTFADTSFDSPRVSGVARCRPSILLRRVNPLAKKLPLQRVLQLSERSTMVIEALVTVAG
jgi:hypothetical protein